MNNITNNTEPNTTSIVQIKSGKWLIGTILQVNDKGTWGSTFFDSCDFIEYPPALFKNARLLTETEDILWSAYRLMRLSEFYKDNEIAMLEDQVSKLVSAAHGNAA